MEGGGEQIEKHSDRRRKDDREQVKYTDQENTEIKETGEQIEKHSDRRGKNDREQVKYTDQENTEIKETGEIPPSGAGTSRGRL